MAGPGLTGLSAMNELQLSPTTPQANLRAELEAAQREGRPCEHIPAHRSGSRALGRHARCGDDPAARLAIHRLLRQFGRDLLAVDGLDAVEQRDGFRIGLQERVELGPERSVAPIQPFGVIRRRCAQVRMALTALRYRF